MGAVWAVSRGGVRIAGHDRRRWLRKPILTAPRLKLGLTDAQASEVPHDDRCHARGQGSSVSAQVRLPPRLDLPAAGPLSTELRDLMGGPIEVDASEVTHIGTPGVQVLLAAAKSWQAGGHDMTLVSPSQSLVDQLAILGLTVDHLSTRPLDPQEE